MGKVNDLPDDRNEPRWLRLAAALRSEPDAATLAHVHARLAARSAGPRWVRWLSRPAVLAACAALLVVSAWTGSVLLSAGGGGSDEDAAVMSTLLGDDGSYGLPVERGVTGGAATSDSEGVTL
jgi:anti-sigma factor RsiW